MGLIKNECQQGGDLTYLLDFDSLPENATGFEITLPAANEMFSKNNNKISKSVTIDDNSNKIRHENQGDIPKPNKNSNCHQNLANPIHCTAPLEHVDHYCGGCCCCCDSHDTHSHCVSSSMPLCERNGQTGGGFHHHHARCATSASCGCHNYQTYMPNFSHCPPSHTQHSCHPHHPHHHHPTTPHLVCPPPPYMQNYPCQPRMNYGMKCTWAPSCESFGCAIIQAPTLFHCITCDRTVPVAYGMRCSRSLCKSKATNCEEIFHCETDLLMHMAREHKEEFDSYQWCPICQRPHSPEHYEFTSRACLNCRGPVY